MGRAAPKDRRINTRDEIVRVGTELIGRNGFNHTGLDTVLKTAGVPKGSFYHYFPSKEDFGLAVIDEFARAYETKLEAHLVNGDGSPLTRLRALLQSTVERHDSEHCRSGCLIGTLGQEMASQHERFRERIDTVFRRWEGSIARCLESAKVAGELDAAAQPETLAKVLLAGWEGAILRSKVTKSVRPMEDFIGVFFDKVLR